jgi:hypothetical protein
MKMIATGIYATLPEGQAIPSRPTGAKAVTLKHIRHEEWTRVACGGLSFSPFLGAREP